jgi:glycosyltransferase involved in cell wall biosynthesis
MMRFHVVSLPHTQTTLAFGACAYTEKVRKFCRMMKDLGHTVFLYSGDDNEAPCDEHVSCISESDRAQAVGAAHYCEASFDTRLPHWRKFNAMAVIAIKQRIRPRDFICLIAGVAHQSIAEAFPEHMAVEFGIGYAGTFSKYRVFESYAWMHMVYGQQYTAYGADGQWFDTVIPGYLERERFPFAGRKEDYYLFIGRLVERKGFSIAIEVCETLGKRLKIAGQGTPPRYGEYVGVVGPHDRGRLMAHATAVFVPTIYIEPFGNVAVEAMACGTPVITSDWGAFTETVVQGKTGFRCRTFQQFLDAAELVKHLDPMRIREHTMAHYSLEAIGPRYDEYFRLLMTLWDDGWYARRNRNVAGVDRDDPGFGIRSRRCG